MPKVSKKTSISFPPMGGAMGGGMPTMPTPPKGKPSPMKGKKKGKGKVKKVKAKVKTPKGSASMSAMFK